MMHFRNDMIFFSLNLLQFFVVTVPYRTRATINRGYYYFFLKTDVGFSLKFVGIPLKMCGYKRRAAINRARLIVARVR